MTDSATKICEWKDCLRKGEQLPLSEFGVNKLRTDGRHYYCKLCTQQINRNARKRVRGNQLEFEKLPPQRRVLETLKGGEALTFRVLARRARLSGSELSDLLPRIHGRDRQVISRNGTGPRVYFLNPSPVVPPAERKQIEPALSFSTISQLHPVIRGQKMLVNPTRKGAADE